MPFQLAVEVDGTDIATVVVSEGTNHIGGKGTGFAARVVRVEGRKVTLRVPNAPTSTVRLHQGSKYVPEVAVADWQGVAKAMKAPKVSRVDTTDLAAAIAKCNLDKATKAAAQAILASL